MVGSSKCCTGNQLEAVNDSAAAEALHVSFHQCTRVPGIRAHRPTVVVVGGTTFAAVVVAQIYHTND